MVLQLGYYFISLLVNYMVNMDIFLLCSECVFFGSSWLRCVGLLMFELSTPFGNISQSDYFLELLENC